MSINLINICLQDKTFVCFKKKKNFTITELHVQKNTKIKKRSLFFCIYSSSKQLFFIYISFNVLFVKKNKLNVYSTGFFFLQS